MLKCTELKRTFCTYWAVTITNTIMVGTVKATVKIKSHIFPAENLMSALTLTEKKATSGGESEVRQKLGLPWNDSEQSRAFWS